MRGRGYHEHTAGGAAGADRGVSAEGGGGPPADADDRPDAGTGQAGTCALSRRTAEADQLLACGGVFVLLVAVKLLLPGKLAQVNGELSGALERNIDVEAVFSAVGRAVSGEADVDVALQDVYQAVFRPGDTETAVEVSAAAGEEVDLAMPDAMAPLRAFRAGTGGSDGWLPAARKTGDDALSGGTRGDGGSVSCPGLRRRTRPRRRPPWPMSSTRQRICRRTCAWSSPCWALTTVLRDGHAHLRFRLPGASGGGGRSGSITGWDIGAAEEGTAISCFADGTVTAVGESSSYGKYVTVSHEGGFSTLYAHCSRILVSSGSAVGEGDPIAEVGETGMVTGPHLHFELHKGSQYLNPIYYVALA